MCNSAAAATSLQSCPTLCNPIDGSPPDSSVPGILQARILEWVAISFSVYLEYIEKILGRMKNTSWIKIPARNINNLR